MIPSSHQTYRFFWLKEKLMWTFEEQVKTNSYSQQNILKSFENITINIYIIMYIIPL